MLLSRVSTKIDISGIVIWGKHCLVAVPASKEERFDNYHSATSSINRKECDDAETLPTPHTSVWSQATLIEVECSDHEANSPKAVITV